jgi:hypothetical protein
LADSIITGKSQAVLQQQVAAEGADKAESA